MHILSIDPGKNAGYAEWYDGRLSHLGTEPPPDASHFDIVVCEDQYPNPKSSRQGLMTLSKGAGARLFEFPATDRLFVPVLVWRRILDVAPANAKKEAYLRALVATLTNEEAAALEPIPAARRPDALDALGLGKAVMLSIQRIGLAGTIAKWHYHPSGRTGKAQRERARKKL